MPKFNRKRPVVMKFRAGSFIGMYKDDPGKFYSESGAEVSDDRARSVGFDVDALRLEKTKMVKLAEAKAKIEREFAAETAAAERQVPETIEREHAEAPDEEEEQDGLVRLEKLPGSGRHKAKYNVYEVATNRILMKDASRSKAEAFAQDVNARGYVDPPVGESEETASR